MIVDRHVDRGWAAQRLDEIARDATRFVATLARSDRPGLYTLCADGLTDAGRTAGLGPTCFAVRTLVTLGAWRDVAPSAARGISEAIVSYLDPETGGFTDPAVEGRLRASAEPGDPFPDMVRLAETKQAMRTLVAVGVTHTEPRALLPASWDELSAFLRSLDWSRPWAAGGRASTALGIAQMCAIAGDTHAAALLTSARGFFDRLADRATGLYFSGTMPGRGEAINGAMKVLTALACLGEEPAEPERLIDTVLAGDVRSEGCHIVDALYVLRACARSTAHRRAEIADRALRMIPMIEAHVRADGGLSYHPRTAQDHYYGVHVTRGPEAGDLHGTCLLTWALAHIAELADLRSGAQTEWRVLEA